MVPLEFADSGNPVIYAETITPIEIRFEGIKEKICPNH